jgi:hypothetical protein
MHPVHSAQHTNGSERYGNAEVHSHTAFPYVTVASHLFGNGPCRKPIIRPPVKYAPEPVRAGVTFWNAISIFDIMLLGESFSVAIHLKAIAARKRWTLG